MLPLSEISALGGRRFPTVSAHLPRVEALSWGCRALVTIRCGNANNREDPTMPKSPDAAHDRPAHASVTPKRKVDPKAVEESHAETVSRPGGFRNDPDDPTSPNEAIERSRRKLRR